MKCFLFIILLEIALFNNCMAQDRNTFNLRQLFSFTYDRPVNPNSEQLSIIRFILKNTYENNIHKMRGETENRVFIHEDGSEVVYDKNGNLVTNSYNRGSFNYYSNTTEPVKKFVFDIAPWLLHGNVINDPTTFNERLYYYTLDLDYGIQSYIFKGFNGQLENVRFNELSNGNAW